METHWESLDSTMLYTEKDLHEVLIYKEQELKELQARQMNIQKTAVQETQKQLEEMLKKFNSLKEDFTYNLKVLEERDRELEHYDKSFMQLKMVENAKQAEVSELRIQIVKLEKVLAQESKKQEALQYQYQQKLKEHQLELKQLHSSKDSDISHHREEYENMKQQLERRLREVEGELALQRQELLVEFDAEMKKREYEFRLKADEMSNLVLSHELKVKLLTKELEALKEAGIKAAESLKMAETTNLELQKEIKSKDWEIKDLAALKDMQIRDLESKLDSVQMSWRKEKEIFEQKLEQELEAMKTSAVSQVAQMSRETVTKDLQIQTLQEEEIKLRAQLTTLLQDIERYKQQLLVAAEREEILERAKVQIELDWQRRCEDAERNQYQKSEALIQSLSTARDQVTAGLQEKEQKLHELEMTLAAVTFERDQAIQELQKYGHLPKGEKQTNVGVIGQGFPSAEIQRLQEQNSTLRAVISEMRREMETLNNQAPPSDDTKMNVQDMDRADAAAVSFNPDDVATDNMGPRKHKIEAPQMDSVETQNPANERLQVNSVHLRQQLLGIGAGDGPNQHIENNARWLHNKLKEAARKICSLSKEKQQLLEMVNGLRAEFGTASKEGFLDPKHSEQHQGHNIPGALYPKELVKETKHRLLALEQLQYQLTTQELQYAQQKHATGKCPLFVENTNSESVPSSSICTEGGEIPLKEVQMVSFVRNSTAEDLKHETLVPYQLQQHQKENPSHFQQGLLSSSGTHNSLEEIWQILEMGSSPSILSPQSNNDQEKSQVAHKSERLGDYQDEGQARHIQEALETPLNIMGTKFHVHSELKPKKPSYKQSRKPQTSQRITKIRNYNVKD